MSPKSVFVIAVTHESGDVVDAFSNGLERLRQESPHDVQAVIVDNASRDGTPERLKARGLDVIGAERNDGWSAGNNLGLARCPAAAELVLFVNPDVSVPADALDRLVDALSVDTDVAAAVPRLRRPDGTLRDGALPDHDLTDAYLGVFGRRRWKLGAFAKRSRSAAGVMRLDRAYPEGGCLLVRRAALDAIGPFDERFFLYYDDEDFGRRLTASGRRAVLACDAVVDETARKGSRAAPGGDAAAERVARYRRSLESELLFYEKWWGRATARRIARYRLRVDLPIQDGRWRRRYGILGLRELVRDVVLAYLARTDDSS